MKRLMIGSALTLAAFASWAAIEITEPARGATVSQLHPMQKKFVRMSQAERVTYFDGAAKAKEIVKEGTQPKPVRIAWTGQDGPCAVQVRRLPDGKVFFDGSATGGNVEVDSLEIAREWEVSVTGGGETAKSTFRTEDQAPRLIFMNKKISNARDLGGRIGLDGRRLRQGLLFRMVGLNDNASFDFCSKAEIEQLYRDGKLKGMGKQGATLAKLLKAGKPLSDSPKRNRLIKQPIKGPGASRMTEKERVAILKRWGFKSDLDLRSDIECHGMTGSPLGPEVKWIHIPYGAYRIDSDYAKARNGKVFRVFLDQKNYPLVFHCIGGADRTGTLACLLEAVLGVDEENLWIDYMTTGFRGTVSDPRHVVSFTRIIDDLKKRPGKNLCEQAEAYFRECGLTDADIAALREILLEKKG